MESVPCEFVLKGSFNVQKSETKLILGFEHFSMGITIFLLSFVIGSLNYVVQFGNQNLTVLGDSYHASLTAGKSIKRDLTYGHVRLLKAFVTL